MIQLWANISGSIVYKTKQDFREKYFMYFQLSFSNQYKFFYDTVAPII